MKKILTALIALVLSSCFCITAFAAGSKTTTVEVLDPPDIVVTDPDPSIPPCPTQAGIIFYKTLSRNGNGPTVVTFGLDADLKEGQQIVVFRYDGTKWIGLEAKDYTYTPYRAAVVQKEHTNTPHLAPRVQKEDADVQPLAVNVQRAYTNMSYLATNVQNLAANATVKEGGTLKVSFDELGPVAIGIYSGKLTSPPTGAVPFPALPLVAILLLSACGAGVVAFYKKSQVGRKEGK